MSETIKLNVINQTTDIQAARLVVCQHNAAAGMRANPIAWRVLGDIAYQQSHAFELPQAFEIAATDAQGNGTDKVSGQGAQAYALTEEHAGIGLTCQRSVSEDNQPVEVRNLLPEAQAEVSAFKEGRLIATRPALGSGETTGFQFHPHVYIGLASGIEEGEALSVAGASRITTRINLFGIESADIIMTSGDGGMLFPQFRLENIQ